MEQPPSEITLRRRLGRDRGENFSLPYGVADCAAPPVSKRRLRSGPNLHPGDTHHCADGLLARDKHLVHDSANARSLGLFLARPRAGAAGGNSHGTTTLGSYLPQATRAGPRREFQSPIRGRGLRRATSVQTPIAVRAKLASGDTHHCADGLLARDKHLVHDCANARSLGLFLARPRAGAAGVETCMEQTITPRERLALTPLVRPAPGRGGSVGPGAEGA